VQEIAERAEFSVGYLYNLFENKQDVFTQLVDLRAEQYIAEVERRLAEAPDVLAQVRTVVSAKLEFFQERQRFFLIFIRMVEEERAEGPVLMPESCRRRYEEHMGRLSEVFARGIKEGVFIDVNPMALVLCMEGMTNAAIAQWIHGAGRAFEPMGSEIIQRVLLEGILVEGRA
jgi:AcrR family transcriptional regulator